MHAARKVLSQKHLRVSSWSCFAIVEVVSNFLMVKNVTPCSYSSIFESFCGWPLLDFGKFASTWLLNCATMDWLILIDATTMRVDSPPLKCKRLRHLCSCDNRCILATTSKQPMTRNAKTTSYNILNNPLQSWSLWIFTNFQHRSLKLLQNWVNGEDNVDIAFLLPHITFFVQLSSSKKRTLFVTLSIFSS